MNTQLELFARSPDEIVNVASVPQRSPFRYPGGKTWLVPRIRHWLVNSPQRPSLLIEPFAGGAIVGLTAAFECLADHVILVELDEEVAAVWKLIIQEDDGEGLANRIEEFDLTPENVQTILENDSTGLQERAFRTVVRNRVSRGGILARGAGLIKYGEKSKGLGSRWYPATLAKRIREISAIRERLTFIHGDGSTIITQYSERDNTVFFVDPPYTAGNGKRAGSRLYNHSELDHERLFQVMESVTGDFLLTYDNTVEVQAMAMRHGFDLQPIAMKSTHHAEMTELLIGRNLKWVRTS